MAIDDDRRIDVLDAPGPHPALAHRLGVFGRFVGRWDLDWCVGYVSGRHSPKHM